MTSTHEALGFWGKRDEARSLLQKTFFAPPVKRIPDEQTGGLTFTKVIDYDSILDDLERLVIDGSEEMRQRYGGREEGV